MTTKSYSFPVALPIQDDSKYTHRYPVSVNIDENPLTEGCVVTVTVPSGWGTGRVTCELTPTEARLLAQFLLNAAEIMSPEKVPA